MKLITDHLDLWSSVYVKKSTTGRGSNGKISPYGIQKLRELILELAVRGKLVAQDPNDEPASVLLEKIVQQEARLIEDGVIKKPRKFPEIEEEEKSIDIPASWEWVRVRRIGHDWGQKKPDNDFSYIDVSAIDNQVGKVSSPSILSPAEAPSRARKIVTRGTVIYSTVRPYLKNIAIVEEEIDPDPIASTAFAILHPYAGIPGEYLVSFFRSPIFVRYVESVQTGIAYPAINDKQFYGAVFPLPPLAEQHRIVAKVDELMALCDQLEQQQTDSLQAHQTLVETLLAELVRPTARDGGSEENAGALFFEHFDTLFTTEESIDQLKQTILQLAVMGRLVPQDPNDEPASALLEKISSAKTSLVKEGKLKKQKILPTIDDEPHALPNGWAWTRLGNITSYGLTEKAEPDEVESETWVLELEDVEKITSKLLQRIRYSDRAFKSSKNRFEVGDVLYGKLRPYLDKVLVADESGVCTTEIMPVRSYAGFVSEYLRLLLKAPSFVAYADELTHGMNLPRLGTDKARLAIVPIPPLAEQHRIVAKVDELMALCDTLKARIQEAQTTQVHLADAVVEQAVA